MRLRIGVLGEAPLVGRCKARLLEAYGPEWVTGLYASMLRDTLDGLTGIDAEDYVVFTPSPGDEEAVQLERAILERHVHAPWSLRTIEAADPVAQAEAAFHVLLDGADADVCALVARSDAPSAPIEPVDAALRHWTGGVVVGPCASGEPWFVALGAASAALRPVPWGARDAVEELRAACKARSTSFTPVAPSYAVDTARDVQTLLDELRRSPELAPRTAHYVVTHA